MAYRPVRGDARSRPRRVQLNHVPSPARHHRPHTQTTLWVAVSRSGVLWLNRIRRPTNDSATARPSPSRSVAERTPLRRRMSSTPPRHCQAGARLNENSHLHVRKKKIVLLKRLGYRRHSARCGCRRPQPKSIGLNPRALNSHTHYLFIESFACIVCTYTPHIYSRWNWKKTAGSRWACFGVRVPRTLDYPTINSNPR